MMLMGHGWINMLWQQKGNGYFPIDLVITRSNQVLPWCYLKIPVGLNNKINHLNCIYSSLFHLAPFVGLSSRPRSIPWQFLRYQLWNLIWLMGFLCYVCITASWVQLTAIWSPLCIIMYQHGVFVNLLKLSWILQATIKSTSNLKSARKMETRDELLQ